MVVSGVIGGPKATEGGVLGWEGISFAGLGGCDDAPESSFAVFAGDEACGEETLVCGLGVCSLGAGLMAKGPPRGAGDFVFGNSTFGPSVQPSDIPQGCERSTLFRASET